MDESRIVTIEYFASPERAQIAKSLLESFGVHAELIHEQLTNTLTVFKTGQVYVELVVNEADAERAREILAAGFDKEEFKDETK